MEKSEEKVLEEKLFNQKKSGWETASEEDKKLIFKFSDEYIEFLNKSKTEREFVNSKNFLWSKKTLVNLEKCAALIAELKANLPEAIQEANYIISKKEQILNNASSQARKLQAEAEFRAEQLVTSSEIFRRSEQEANELIESAQQKCAELYAVTRENIDKMLSAVEQSISQDLQMVKTNRKELESTLRKLQVEDNLKKNQK